VDPGLAAIAFRLSRSTGFYRAPGSRSQVFMIFGDVKMTDASGSTQTFRINPE